MDLFGIESERGLELAGRVHSRFAPVFERMSAKDRAALALYFLPHRSAREALEVTRPRILKWYCPFADQREFPTGHRYCINVYAGCSHGCHYCYAAAYEPVHPKCKENFEKGLQRDLLDLDRFDVPPAPVHLSNSTDPFQSLEEKAGQTYYSLKQILKYRHRFTSVVLLTKNPILAARGKYLEILQQLNGFASEHPRKETLEKKGLPGLRVEVSLAFRRDSFRRFYDAGSPCVEERMEAIRILRDANIPVVLRIDPLLPRNPLPSGKRLEDFCLPDAQSLDDLDALLAFAAEVKVMHVVYSVAKIVSPRRNELSEVMNHLKLAYRHIAGDRPLIFRGGSWRIPDDTARESIIQPFLDLCRQRGISAFYCKQNLIATP